jgi:signal transduction histidine kinase
VTGHHIGRSAAGGPWESLSAEARGSLAAIGRVARAVVGARSLLALAQATLEEMRATLGLSIAALYLPAPGAGRSLVRFIDSVDAQSGVQACDRLDFEEEAWALAVRGGAPLVFREEAAWLVANPFQPPSDSWLLLPLPAGDGSLGVVAAASQDAIALDAASATVLTLMGDLVGVGIETARLREELQQAALEGERIRLAAEVHDGLAQDLAVAMRELALLGAEPSPDVAAASRARLEEAVASAHAVVRSQLRTLVRPGRRDALGPAVEEICRRFAERGLPVTILVDDAAPLVPADRMTVALRVLSEALANAERHAAAGRVDVEVASRDDRLTLAIGDDGRGFVPPGEEDAGHLGIRLMHERARAAGGLLTVSSSPRSGTRVVLELPLPLSGA